MRNNIIEKNKDFNLARPEVLTISVWGLGFVGMTAYKAFSRLPKENFKVLGFDKNEEISKNKKEECLGSYVHFVCVPTPMMKDTGECYTKIIEGVVEEIRSLNKNSIICIKSTVPPGTTRTLNEKFGKVVFSPEFLTEKSPLTDFCFLGYQIIGSDLNEEDFYLKILKEIFETSYKEGIQNCKELYVTSSIEAEMVKYTRNCYLAVRLSFFNEIKQLCDKLGINYKDMKFLAGLDERVGNHYNEIDENNPGWGLSCLPKDLNSMIFVAKCLDISPLVLEAAWKKNLEVRNFKDWEDMEKAVYKK